MATSDHNKLSALKSGPTGDRLPRRADFLAGLPEDLTRALLAGSSIRHLKPGQVLFWAGDPGDGLYRVEDGILKVTVGAASGAERILAILGPGAIVGDLAVLDGRPRSATVTALRDCSVRFVSRSAFESLSADHPEIYKHLIQVLAARLRDADMTLAASSFLPLKGRVALAILDLAEAFGKDVGGGRILIHQKISQTDIAAIAGVARENVSRILNEWMKENVISRLSQYYCLENRAKVKAQANL